MDKRQDTQHEYETLVKWANATPITVSGEADAGTLMVFRVTSPVHNVVFSRVDLLTENGNTVCSFNCERSANPTAFTVDAGNVREWVDRGTPIAGRADRSLYLRVYMYFKGHESEVSRQMVVYRIGDQFRWNEIEPGEQIVVNKIEGGIT